MNPDERPQKDRLLALLSQRCKSRYRAGRSAGRLPLAQVTRQHPGRMSDSSASRRAASDRRCVCAVDATSATAAQRPSTMLSSPIGFPPPGSAGLVRVRIIVSTNRPVAGFITVRKAKRVSDCACCRERIGEIDFLDSGPGANDGIRDRRYAQYRSNRLDGEDRAAGRDLNFPCGAPSGEKDREGRQIAVARPHDPGAGPGTARRSRILNGMKSEHSPGRRSRK